jgi:hypothetical protein
MARIRTLLCLYDINFEYFGCQSVCERMGMFLNYTNQTSGWTQLDGFLDLFVIFEGAFHGLLECDVICKLCCSFVLCAVGGATARSFVSSRSLRVVGSATAHSFASSRSFEESWN